MLVGDSDRAVALVEAFGRGFPEFGALFGDLVEINCCDGIICQDPEALRVIATSEGGAILARNPVLRVLLLPFARPIGQATG